VSGGVGRVERVLHQLVSKCFVGAAKQQHSRAFLLRTTTHVDVQLSAVGGRTGFLVGALLDLRPPKYLEHTFSHMCLFTYLFIYYVNRTKVHEK